MKAPVLLNWIRADLFRYSSDDNLEILEQTDSSCRVRIYTDVNVYSITARAETDGGYLGAMGKSRKPRAGEDWTRGNDLADGPLNLDTWRQIKDCILSYEMVVLAKNKQKRPIPG